MKNWQVGDKRSIVHKFVSEDVSLFVSLTGDDNKIHVSNNYARTTSAGGVIVHGMLAASYVSTLIGKQIPGDGAVWSSFNVIWRNPIRIGDTVRFDAKIVAISESTGVITLSIVGRNETRGNDSLEATAKVIRMEESKQLIPLTSDVNLAMKGKRILITGASGVVGGAIASKLLTLGSQPVLWGRNSERLAVSGAEWVEVELMNADDIDSALTRFLAGGRVDGFVHVAAPPIHHAAMDDFSNLAELRSHLLVGPEAFARLCSKLLPVMEKESSVVAVLTQYVIGAPPPKMSAYVASKLALLGLVRSVAVEAGMKGIRCNSVSPGLMNTPYSEGVSIRQKQIDAAMNPLRRLCTPSEVAEAVCFLLSPAASFVNGTNLPITGGAEML